MRNTLKAAEMLAANGWELEKTEQLGKITRLQYEHPHLGTCIAAIWEDNTETHCAGDELVYTGVPGLPYQFAIDLDREVIEW